MSNILQRSTIYFKPELHRALRIKAAETQRSVSDIVNDAVQTALREDKGERADFGDRVSEPTVTYEELGNKSKVHGISTFNDVLEAAEKLALDEKETLIDILKKRLIDHRRAELIKEVQNAEQEYQKGQCKPATPSEIMKEILS